jgi:hypothetical protein
MDDNRRFNATMQNGYIIFVFYCEPQHREGGVKVQSVTSVLFSNPLFHPHWLGALVYSKCPS